LVREDLLACCASQCWADEMAAGEPYPDVDALVRASDEVLAKLAWADIEQALSAHPRIGERAAGQGREAQWSRGEQSAAETEDERLRAELVEGNRVYERHFGYVFLICASGLPVEAVLASLRQRLGNDESTERDVVREELRKIVRLRLAKL
jgi:2-oxo-4-hydroxy-4-carboxy-5-ureidoimidazoline decarboxylase